MSIASLTTALCLPALEIEALLQGRIIVAPSQTFRNPLQFVLCPVTAANAELQARERYQAGFLRSVKGAFDKPETKQTTLRAWAKLNSCRIYNELNDLEALSKLTVWRTEYLEELIKRQDKLFLMTLQVYRFEQSVTMPVSSINEDKAGRYIRLPSAPTSRSSESIINETAFAHRKQQLFDLTSPLHPELEALQAELVQVRESGLGAMSLDRDLRYLLGWSRTDQTKLDDSDLVWIRQIAQAGAADNDSAFERLVRQSLIKLGFGKRNGAASPWESRNTLSSLNSQTRSSTDELSIRCKAPYPLVGQCKASKHGHIPSSVIEQLMHLSNAPRQSTDYSQGVKIVFAAGSLKNHAKQTAINNCVNIMRPETLQRLTELQAQHPGAIDLYKLKPCLQSAPFAEEADTKVNLFIDNILQQLEVRAELIRAVKNCLENTGESSVGTDAVFFVYAASASQAKLPQLSRQEVQETLIELSSPLAGYLGRVDDIDALADRRSHRFYFLRELHLEHGALSATR
ncbi:MAG: DUF1802 family protein [Cyanobacteria bacterium P01_D01_bin.36]